MPDEQKPALVALEARRETVISLLNNGYAEDLLDGGVFEERISRAHTATDLSTLDQLVADLVVPAQAALVKASSTGLATDLATAPRQKQLRALFSSIEKRGSWSVPTSFATSAVFGNALLDLSDARLQPGVTELRVRAVFGSLEIIVPPGLSVECDGRAIFASFEDQTTQSLGGAVARAKGTTASASSLRIVGSAVFGSIEIKVREHDGDDHAEPPPPRGALPAHEHSR